MSRVCSGEPLPVKLPPNRRCLLGLSRVLRIKVKLAAGRGFYSAALRYVQDACGCVCTTYICTMSTPPSAVLAARHEHYNLRLDALGDVAYMLHTCCILYILITYILTTCCINNICCIHVAYRLYVCCVHAA